MRRYRVGTPKSLAVGSTIGQDSMNARIEALQPLRSTELELAGLPSMHEWDDQAVSWDQVHRPGQIGERRLPSVDGVPPPADARRQLPQALVHDVPADATDAVGGGDAAQSEAAGADLGPHWTPSFLGRGGGGVDHRLGGYEASLILSGFGSGRGPGRGLLSYSDFPRFLPRFSIGVLIHHDFGFRRPARRNAKFLL